MRLFCIVTPCELDALCLYVILSLVTVCFVMRTRARLMIQVSVCYRSTRIHELAPQHTKYLHASDVVQLSWHLFEHFDNVYSSHEP